MSKIYTASMLRRPASPRSDKLKAVNGGSSSSSHSSSSSSSIVPAAADSVFWKYFGLDENGDLYVKPKEDEEPRSLWTYGNLAAGGIRSDEEPSPSPSEGSSVTWDQRYPSTGERIAIISIDGQDINVYAPGALTEGTDYLSPANVQSRIDAAVNPISALIPAAASAQNQLADKAFVNSSIASNTGVFQGTFSSTSQLPSTGVNTNDYAFVTTQDEHGQTVYNRYKYNGTQWVFEYALNNSSFTAAQWSAINSGITAQKVSGYDALVSNVQADWNATTGLAVILNKPSLATVATSGSYNDLSNKPSAVLYTSQSLNSTQQAQARTNIGAGTSSFSGNYNDLSNKPSAVLYTSQSLTNTQKSQARTNIGAGTSSFSGAYNDLSGKPTFTNKAATLTAGQTVTVATIGGVDITVVVPSFALASALNSYQPLDADLTAIAGLSSGSGLLKRNVNNTWTLDSNIEGNASNGNTAYGYFSNGVLPYNHGGTGQSTWTKGQMLYASANNTLAKLDANSGAKKFLVMANSVPSWSGIASGDLPSLYVAQTPVSGTPANATLLGVDGFTNASSASASNDKSKVVWEPNAGGTGVGAWHFYGGIYSDSFISAGGLNSGSGGGGGVENLWALHDVYSVNGAIVHADNSAINEGDVLTYNATKGWLAAPTAATVTEQTVAGWGFTKNAGTITGITMNGASKGTSGVVDLGTVITQVTSSTVTNALGFTPYNATNPNGYQANVLESVKVNGTAIGISSKAVDIVLGLYACGQNGTSNAQTGNGNTYINLARNSGATGAAKLGGVKVTGSQNVTVTSNASGTITVTGPDLSTYVPWSDFDTIIADYQTLMEPGVDYVEPSTLNDYLTTANAASTYLPKTSFLFDIRSKDKLQSENLNTIYDPSFGDMYGRFRYYSYVGATPWPPVSGTHSTAGTNGFPTSSNANALLTIDTYSDADTLHLYQLGFSGNGSIYYRNGAAVKQNGSWVNPWSNGRWNRLVAEDYNGDAVISRNLSAAGNIGVERGNRINLDANGDAYITRGTGTDYGLYICAGRESDGTTRPYVFFEARAFLPGAATNDFGTDWMSWNNIWAKRWYPNPGDSSHYIEWDSSAGAFKIVGDVYATGQVAAGGIVSNS